MKFFEIKNGCFCLLYQRVKSRSNILDDGNGSVGPIRRTRNKAALSTPRGPSFSHSALHGPALFENSDVSGGFLPGVKKNLQPGASSCTSKFLMLDNKPQSNEVSVPKVNPQSSLLARKILEHLDRNPPTPKEKLDELKLATSWKKTLSSEVATTSENPGTSHFGGFDFHKNKNVVDQKFPPQRSEDRRNSLSKVEQPERTNEATDAVNKIAPMSNMFFCNTAAKHSENALPSSDFKKTLGVEIKTPNEVFHLCLLCPTLCLG